MAAAWCFAVLGVLGVLHGEVSAELHLTGDGVQVQAGSARLLVGAAWPGAGPVGLVHLDGDAEEAGHEADGGHQPGEHQQFVFVFLHKT